MSGAQKQMEDDQAAYLWHSLQALKRFISAEVFQQAEKELGFNQNEESSYGQNRYSIRQSKERIRARTEGQGESALPF